MWPFSQHSTERKGEEDRLGTVSRRLDDVESAVRMLKGEWLDTLDRIDRQVGRLVKRSKRDAEAAAVEPPQANGHGSDEPPDEVAVRRSRRANPAGGV